MKKVIRLTESELKNIIRKVLNENSTKESPIDEQIRFNPEFQKKVDTAKDKFLSTELGKKVDKFGRERLPAYGRGVVKYRKLSGKPISQESDPRAVKMAANIQKFGDKVRQYDPLSRVIDKGVQKLVQKGQSNEAAPSPLAKSGAPPAPPVAPTFSYRPKTEFYSIPSIERKPPSPPPPPPKTIFGIGDRDPKILAFQKNLVALGYNVGKRGADGIFGPSTEAAVKDFQQKHGIKVSGRVGPPTMRKLAAVVKARSEYDPNAEWNRDRAYPKSTVEKPTPEWAQDRAYANTQQQPVQQKTSSQQPVSPKSAPYKALNQKFKNFNDWVIKNRLY